MADSPDADYEGPDAEESDRVKTKQRPEPAKCKGCKATFYVGKEYRSHFGVANRYACSW